MTKVFAILSFGYLKSHKALILILSFIVGFYLYFLFILQPTYVRFPLERMLDILSNVHQYFTKHMVMKARLSYTLSLLTMIYLIFSYSSAMAITSFFERESFSNMLFLKNRGLKRDKNYGFFIGVFSLFLIVSTILGVLTSILVITHSSFKLEIMNLAEALLIMSVISSFMALCAVGVCRSSLGVTLFYLGYFIVGGVLGKLAGMEVVPYKFKYTAFSISTLHQMVSKLVMGVDLSGEKFVPILVLFLMVVCVTACTILLRPKK